MSKHRYEGLLVLNIKGREDGAQKIIDRIEKDIAAEGCTLESVQKMDTRHFSYVAGKLDSGFYVTIAFAAEPAALDRLKAKFKMDDDIYRHQYARLSDKPQAPKPPRIPRPARAA